MFNVNDFRLPEELEYNKKLKSHLEILKNLIPGIFQQEQQTNHGLSDYLKMNGEKITKSSGSNIIQKIENSFHLFEIRKQKFCAFTVKNFDFKGVTITEENAIATFDNRLLVFIFVHDFLDIFNPAEIAFAVGHEVGHFLLGHLSKNKELESIIQRTKEIGGIFDKSSDFVMIKKYAYFLLQLHELSADRVGLLVSKDLESAITGLIKLDGGHMGKNKRIEDFIKEGKNTRLEASDIYENHPYPSKRSWALDEFCNSDLFNKVLGKEDGTPISKFSDILPEIIVFPKEDGGKVTEGEADDYILEKIFYYMIAEIDRKATPAEIRTINDILLIPATKREEVMQKWDDIVKDFASKTERQHYEYYDKLARQYYSRIARRNSSWKTKFIKRLIKVAKSDHRIYEREINKIIEIAKKINAKKECSQQFLKEFGYIPLGQEELS